MEIFCSLNQLRGLTQLDQLFIINLNPRIGLITNKVLKRLLNYPQRLLLWKKKSLLLKKETLNLRKSSKTRHQTKLWDLNRTQIWWNQHLLIKQRNYLHLLFCQTFRVMWLLFSQPILLKDREDTRGLLLRSNNLNKIST